MELGIYLLKSIAILTIFYLVYFLFLRKDTLFTAKRHYLLGGILAALLLPFLEFTKTIYKEAPVFEAMPISTGIIVPTEIQNAPQIVSLMDWWQIALVIYMLGVVFMLGRLCYQLISLLRLIRTYPSEKQKKYTFVRVTENIAPFSFFRYIVYNPASHSESDLKMILKHEQVHASQWHSVDLIIGNFARIVQWVNPFSWFYKKSLEENLEYIADNQTVAQLRSKKQYQLTLIKASSPLHVPALTTQFYQSFIKKRIIMLNKNTSNRQNIWKLSIVLPAIALFLWSFNVTEVVTYKENSSLISEHGDNLPIFKILSTSSEVQLNHIEQYFAENHPEALVKIKDRSRNSTGELVSFSFNTKFKSNDRFYKRFEVSKSEDKSFEGYRLRYSEGPALFVEQLVNEGDRFKITAARLQFLSEIELTPDHMPEESEPILGENPLYIVNGHYYSTESLPALEKLINKDGIVLYNKKEAVAKYGMKAKDGAMLFKGKTVFDSEKEVKTENEMEIADPVEEAEIEVGTISEFKFEITKNTTNKELEIIKKELMAEHQVDLNYSVTRNNAQEITSINISYSSKTGNSGSYNVTDEGPIDAFTFFYDKDGKSGFWSEKQESRRNERMGKKMAEMKARKMKMQQRMVKRLKEEEEFAEIKEERREEMEERREEMEEREVEIEKRSGNLARIAREKEKMAFKEMKEREKEMAARYMELAKIEKKRAIARANGNGRSSYTYSSDGEGAEHAIIIDKDTSDSTLANIKTKMAAQGIVFNYSRVKRNANGEITRIKITTDNGKGSKSTISSSADDGEPIDDILIEL